MDLWADAINNEKAFVKGDEELNGSIKLSALEQSDLYEILALDKVYFNFYYIK